jgi:hypothetical protein
LWTQIVGKVRLVCAPTLSHWWHATLYVSPRGLTTGPIPYGADSFEIEFDFNENRLRIRRSPGGHRQFPLEGNSVSDFYRAIMTALADLGIDVTIHGRPNEVDPAIPFLEDTIHASYDPEAASLFWQQLIRADRVMQEFRAHFTGKVSPVHYFWGGMDLACTRFSGRDAPPYTNKVINCPDWVMTDSYNKEVSSCGFWPGGGDEGAFYAYAYPEPAGYGSSPVGESGAFYSAELGGFLLPYEAVRQSEDPAATLSRFLHDTYEAAAVRADWNRAELEIDPFRFDRYRTWN